MEKVNAWPHAIPPYSLCVDCCLRPPAYLVSWVAIIQILCLVWLLLSTGRSLPLLKLLELEAIYIGWFGHVWPVVIISVITGGCLVWIRAI